MSRQPYGTTTPEQRDQAAEDRDLAAWQRDRAGAARDRAADERDRRADARTQAVLQYTRLTLRQLDAAAGETSERSTPCSGTWTRRWDTPA
jgi:hypothetical protein